MIATAGPRSSERVRTAGADEVFGHGLPELSALVDVVLNLAPVDPMQLAALTSVVRDGGIVVNTTVWMPAPSDEERGVRGVNLFVNSDAAQLARLVTLVDAGALHVDIARRVPLAELLYAARGGRRRHALRQGPRPSLRRLSHLGDLLRHDDRVASPCKRSSHRGELRSARPGRPQPQRFMPTTAEPCRVHRPYASHQLRPMSQKDRTAMSLGFDPAFAQVFAPMAEAMSHAMPPAVGDVPARRAIWEPIIGAASAAQPIPTDVTTAEHHATAADGTQITMRWYAKTGAAAGPAVLFFHGGGYIFGHIDLFDGPVSRYVSASGVPMLSVEYRRAPEHPFPTPLEDAYAALCWLHEHAA